MRIIGIDLAVTAKHRAIVLNERSQFITPIISFYTELAALDELRAKALEGASTIPRQCAPALPIYLIASGSS